MSNKEQEKEIAQTLGLHKSTGRRIFWRIITVAVIIGLLYGAYLFLQRRKNESEAVHYSSQPVKIGNLVVTVNATGTLEPVNEVEVGSEVSGMLKTVDADFNDKVTVGQILARIDTSKLDAEVEESEAALEAAHAQVTQYEATLKESKSQMARLEQVRKLSDGKVPSVYEFEAQEATVARAKANVANAKASVSKAEATLRVNKSDVKKAVIHSPINGVVLTRLVEEGQTVAATMETPILFTLAEDLKQLELQVDVDEADVGQVHEGQEATFTVDAYPDKHFPAAITQVRYGSTTTDGVVTYTTVLKVNNDDLSLRPGMTATAVITTKKLENALLVPCAALRFSPPQLPAASAKPRNGSIINSLLPHPPRNDPKLPETPESKEQKVYILRDGDPCVVPVTTGMTDGIYSEVTEGSLEAGMEVVTDMTTGGQ